MLKNLLPGRMHFDYVKVRNEDEFPNINFLSIPDENISKS